VRDDASWKYRFARERASSWRASITEEIIMDACASTALQHSPTRFLLVDTDNLFLDGVGGALQANENIDVVAIARSIEDAYDCTARHKPDVIVISWGKASRAFVHAVLANHSSAQTKPLIVIVLPRGITSIPGLTSLSLLPNVALLVHEQIEKLMLRHNSSKPPRLLH
jgi:DNA-binding NarL/FixJ family response regulator